MWYESIKEQVCSLPGIIGVYYKNLKSFESYGLNDEKRFLAASVIKIPVLIEAFNQEYKRKISFEETIRVTDDDKVPDCGAIAYMHEGLEVTIRDLCNLMIILSDNTATNILIKYLGMDNINTTMKLLGLEKTRINRLLFDSNEQKKGKENYFSPLEIGLLLEKMWNSELISPMASQEMINILKLQQINHKIPYFIPKDVAIAHKTGEDEGITHDVALVFSNDPFILCFASNKTDVAKAEIAMRNIAVLCYEHTNIKEE